MSSKRIFVGGLPYSVSDQQLEELFSAHGSVDSARVITDRVTGRSRGFGFVEMPNEEEAEEAIRKLNGTDLDGRALTVNAAKPRMDRGDGPPRSDRRDRW